MTEIEKQKKLLQIHDLPRPEIVEREPEPGGGMKVFSHDLDKEGKIKIGDKEFCMRYGQEEDFKDLRKKLEKRIADRPKTTAVRCSKCGARFVIRGAVQEGMGCLSCNRAGVKGGGFLRAMSKGEVGDWEKDKKAEWERWRGYREKQKAAAQVASRIELGKLR